MFSGLSGIPQMSIIVLGPDKDLFERSPQESEKHGLPQRLSQPVPRERLATIVRSNLIAAQARTQFRLHRGSPRGTPFAQMS